MSDTKIGNHVVDEEAFLAKYANIGLCASEDGGYMAKVPAFFMLDKSAVIQPLIGILRKALRASHKLKSETAQDLESANFDDKALACLREIKEAFSKMYADTSPFKSLGGYNAIYADRVAWNTSGNDPSLFPMSRLRRLVDFPELCIGRDGEAVGDREFSHRLSLEELEELDVAPGGSFDPDRFLPMDGTAIAMSARAIISFCDGFFDCTTGVDLAAGEVEEYAWEVSQIAKDLQYAFEGGVHANVFECYGVCAVRSVIADLQRHVLMRDCESGSENPDSPADESEQPATVQTKIAAALEETYPLMLRFCEVLDVVLGEVGRLAPEPSPADHQVKHHRRALYNEILAEAQNARASLILKQFVLPGLPFTEMVKTRQTSIWWSTRHGDPMRTPRQRQIATDVMNALRTDPSLSTVPVTAHPYVPRYAVKCGLDKIALSDELPLTAYWVFPYLQSVMDENRYMYSGPGRTVAEIFAGHFCGEHATAKIGELAKKHNQTEKEIKELLDVVVTEVGRALGVCFNYTKSKQPKEDGPLKLHAAIWFV